MNCTITINDLSDRSDYELFKKVCCTSHSLHHLLPLQVISVRVVILSSCLSVLLICI